MNCNATAIRKPSNMLKVAESGKRADVAEATDHVPSRNDSRRLASAFGGLAGITLRTSQNAPAGFYFDARDAPRLSGAQRFVFA